MRKLIDGGVVDSLDCPVDLIIHTKAPGKWKIIDMETGEEYIGQNLSNVKFAEILRNKVSNGQIGSWKKIKFKDVYVQQTLL
ncbi:MAG: hypothetical protein EB150_07750 [Nitrososphaeria archaeon]|jgi:hypothetical protein|nr:hypothetical protein [Nitrososphaeria archaeon]